MKRDNCNLHLHVSASSSVSLPDGLELPTACVVLMEPAASVDKSMFDMAANSWIIYTMSCVECHDAKDGQEPTFALRVLLTHIDQLAEINAFHLLSVADILKLTYLRADLDLRSEMTANTTYEEFMTLRQNLKSPSLGIFEDKVKLRQELLDPMGAAHTPTYFMSAKNCLCLLNANDFGPHPDLL